MPRGEHPVGVDEDAPTADEDEPPDHRDVGDERGLPRGLPGVDVAAVDDPGDASARQLQGPPRRELGRMAARDANWGKIGQRPVIRGFIYRLFGGLRHRLSKNLPMGGWLATSNS